MPFRSIGRWYEANVPEVRSSPPLTIAFDDKSIEFRVRFTFLVRRFTIFRFPNPRPARTRQQPHIRRFRPFLFARFLSVPQTNNTLRTQ